MNCPICRQETGRTFQKGEYWVRLCRGCCHEFIEYSRRPGHVRDLYTDDYFTGGGAGYRNYLADETLLTERGRRYGELLAMYADPGFVFDVGAAAGFLLKGMCEAGWRGGGMEPNESMALYAREVLKLGVCTGELETFCRLEPADAVTVIQVAGHLIDPAQCFDRIRDLVRPGGLLLVETWDVRSWTARLLRAQWPEYSPPTVLHFFSRQSLHQLVHDRGFCFVASGSPYKPISGHHLKSLLRYKAADSMLFRCAANLTQVIPDRFRVHYPFDDLFWALYRRTGPAGAQKRSLPAPRPRRAGGERHAH